MDWFAHAFVKASLAWLAFGVTLGVAMAANPAWTVYKPAHMHMTLLGFVTMMIYGVAYHVVPRFVGSPLWSKRLPVAHVWVSNIGLALMCVGFVARVQPTIVSLGTIMLAAGGTLSALGAYVFAFNLWKTMNAGAKRQALAKITIAAVARDRAASP
jgi:cbb3-type cytochrome oxidase subunit 1